VVRISPGYFETLGTPVLAGRAFTDADRDDAAPVAVVSRSLAQRRLGGGGVGARIHVRGASREIVGVVGDVQQSLIPQAGGAPEAIYLPIAENPPRRAHVLARTAGPPVEGVAEVRSELEELDPDLTVTSVEPMEDYAGRYLVGFDVFNGLLNWFSLFALLLATLGTYGVTAYSVGQRLHEIGVRLAVGASPRAVLWMIVRGGMTMAGAGLLLGTALLVPLLRVLGAALEGLTLPPVDPATVVATGAALFVVTVLAAGVPAFRASGVDPVRVLKDG